MAEGLVLVPRADGTLEPTGGAGFARHFGVAAEGEARRLLLFGGDTESEDGASDAAGLTAAAASAPPARIPAPEILAEIEATALRYAAHTALRQAGLSASDWLLLYQGYQARLAQGRASAAEIAGAGARRALDAATAARGTGLANAGRAAQMIERNKRLDAVRSAEGPQEAAPKARG